MGKKTKDSGKNSGNEKLSNDENVLDMSDFSSEGDDIQSIGDEVVSADSSPQEDFEELYEEAKKQNLYLQAEFENYKRKALKERSDLIKFGAERLARDLLNVSDIFDMALKTEVTAETLDNFYQGVKMTSKELEACLERHSVKKVPCLGDAFDPSLHEALSSEETDEVPPGHIFRVYKEAFKLHDRVIRPAQVVVAKAPENNESEGHLSEENGE